MYPNDAIEKVRERMESRFDSQAIRTLLIVGETKSGIFCEIIADGSEGLLRLVGQSEVAKNHLMSKLQLDEGEF
jgi:hypothetical protein